VSDPVQAIPSPGQGEHSSRALSALAGVRGCDAQRRLKAHATQSFNDGSAQGKVPLAMPPVPGRSDTHVHLSSHRPSRLRRALHQPRLSEGLRADGGNAIRKRLRPGGACRERRRGQHSDRRRKVSGLSYRHPLREPDLDDSRNVGWRDRRPVGLGHLVHLGLPGGFRQRRLVQHHARRMACKAVAIEPVRPLAGEQPIALGEIDIDGWLPSRLLAGGPVRMGVAGEAQRATYSN
jgi:hypothetical protein